MTAKKAKFSEWVGGKVGLPISVTGYDECPEFHGWLEPAAHWVLSSDIVPADSSHEVTVDAFEKAMRQPLAGPPRRPDRVRVESPALAELLRARYPDISVVVGPTPELDIFQAELRSFLEQSGRVQPSYFENGVGPETVGAFFKAAARFYRAAPWKILPSENWMFGLTIEAYGIRDHVVSIIGGLGESFGAIIFESFQELREFCDMQEAFDRGAAPDTPPHIGFTLSPAEEIAPRRRQEVKEFGLELAGKGMHPELVFVESIRQRRSPREEEYAWVEAMALAFADLVEKGPDLKGLHGRGESLDFTTVVGTHAGPVTVRLQAPFSAPLPSLEGTVFELLERLAALPPGAEEEGAPAHLRQEIFRRFLASPERVEAATEGDGLFILGLGLDVLNLSLIDLDPRALRRILLTVAPRQATLAPEAAEGAVRELRALFAFLKREAGFLNADACTKVLSPATTRKLRKELGDPSNFGLAKAFVYAGTQAGFDMTTPEGIEELQNSFNAALNGEDPPSPRRPGSKKAAKKKPNKKAAPKPPARKKRPPRS